MSLATRIAAITFILSTSLIFGCSSGGGGSDGTTTPVNHPPEVNLLVKPAAVISPTDNAVFAWSGSDQDGDLQEYFFKLTGAFQQTHDTTITYSGLTPGASYSFAVFAVDSSGQHSDTATWSFQIADIPPELQLVIFGQGLTDADQDLFWTDYVIRWSPQVTGSASLDLRLIVAIQSTSGLTPEILDSTDIITRSPSQQDTLTYAIAPNTKGFYGIRAEIHGADGTVLLTIPYDSLASLTNIGLEDQDGTVAWFHSADRFNELDLLPTGSPDGYYESLDIWWDVDSYGDPIMVKVVVHERSAAEELLGQEHFLYISFLNEIRGIGSDDLFGTSIEAGTTFSQYDYRLTLLDQDDNLLDEIGYGLYPELTNVPLGQTGAANPQNRAFGLTK